MYETGSVIAGKYRIERELGSGGMGVVYAATHLQLGTQVALKFLHEQMTHNPSVVDRFMREARASALLRGENVCRVSDVGTHDRGCPFMVMELLAGQDLGTLLRNHGTLPVATAAEVIMQACIALGEAHAIGIVHRDIKPGNLFWTQRLDGSTCIKVLDFGVAKAPEEIHYSPNTTANLIGSPGYMSPEQLKASKTVDARSDIWSLGIVLYELVSGGKPFQGESITDLALRVAMDPPPTLTGVPSSFESVILRCLEKEPQRRFKTVAELAGALAPFVGPVRGAELAYAVSRVLLSSGPTFAASPPQRAPAAASTPTTLRGASGVVTPTAAAQRSWRLPAAIGLGAAVGIVLALVIVMGGKQDRVVPAAEPAGVTRKMTAQPTVPATAPAAEPAPPPAATEAKAPAAAEAKPEPERRVVRTSRPAAKPVAKKSSATKPAPAKPKPKPTKPKRPSAGDIGDSRL